MTNREMIIGGFYDYSSNKIECVADAIGIARIVVNVNTAG